MGSITEENSKTNVSGRLRKLFDVSKDGVSMAKGKKKDQADVRDVNVDSGEEVLLERTHHEEKNSTDSMQIESAGAKSATFNSVEGISEDGPNASNGMDCETTSDLVPAAISQENSVSIASEIRSTAEDLIEDGTSKIKDEILEGKWVIRTYCGFKVTLAVDLNKERPTKFDSIDDERRWDKANEMNLIRMKHQIQNGEYLPEDASFEVDFEPLRPRRRNCGKHKDPPSPTRERQKLVEKWCNEKVDILKREMKLLELVVNIREQFCNLHNMTRGLELMNDVFKLNVTRLMLIKSPFVIDTFRCLSYYEGPNELSKYTSAAKLIEEIQSRAKEIYHKFKLMFSTPVEKTFEDYFEEQSRFIWRIFRYEDIRVYNLMHEPV